MSADPNTPSQQKISLTEMTEKLERLCTDTSQQVDLGTMLKEFGGERLIGMLHAFVLLKPVVSKALRDKEEQIVKEADLNRFDHLKDGPKSTLLSPNVAS